MSTDVPAGFEPMNASDGFVNHVGPIYIRWERDTAALGFHVLPHHCNPANMCHGGMLMTVMDMGIAVALKAATKSDKFLPTINLSFDFLAPGKVGMWLQSECSFTFSTKRMGFAHGLLIGPEGPVVRANGIMKIPSDTDPRYQDARRRIGNPPTD